MAATIREQILINARALIADPAHWTRGTLARTARDKPIEWRKAAAAKWCVLGALYRAAYDLVGKKEQAIAAGRWHHRCHLSSALAPECPSDAQRSRGALRRLGRT